MMGEHTEIASLRSKRKIFVIMFVYFYPLHFASHQLTQLHWEFCNLSFDPVTGFVFHKKRQQTEKKIFLSKFKGYYVN